MKKKSLLQFAFLMLLSLLLNGCYNDNEEELYPGGSTCDLTNVAYSTTVAPIFANSCNSCHSSSSPSGNIITDNYASVKANMSRIRGAINHQSGFSPMPKDSQMLSPCDLSKIDVWINQGMPNN
jgi:hypothetical protein